MFLHNDKELFRDVIEAASADQNRPVAIMSICHSAQEGVDVTKLLREIIDKEVYKSDYKEITTYFQNEPLEYDTAIRVIETVIDSGVF